MPTELPEPDSPKSNSKGLGKAAGRGFSWMSLSLIIGKVFIFFAQVVLGWVFLEEDFAIFAIVTSAIAFVKIFHDGGIPLVLVQRGSAEFERLQGAAFWMGMGISVAAAIVLAVVSPWIGSLYGDDRLAPLLQVLAVTLPLGSPANLLRAKLQLDLQFRTISLIAVSRFAIRSLGMIVLALSGFGVICFVIPMLVVALFENTATYLATRAKPWLHPVRFREWPGLLKDSYWVVFATIFRGLARFGDYLALGLLIPASLLGRYFFGCQFTIQITFLVALNLRHVLFPVMTKLANQPARQSKAIVRSIQMLMLVAAPASMLIAAIIRPVEEFVWRLNWVEAVPLMQIFAVVSPMLILSDVIHAAMTSRGQFRLSGLLTLVEGLWLVASAWLAVKLAGANNITAVALWIFGLRIAYVLAVSTWVLNSFQIRPTTFLRSFLPQWTVALVAGGSALAVGQWLPSTVSPIVQIPVLTTVFLTVFVGVAMLVLRSELQDLANVAPRPIAAVVRKVFLLPQTKNTSGGG